MHTEVEVCVSVSVCSDLISTLDVLILSELQRHTQRLGAITPQLYKINACIWSRKLQKYKHTNNNTRQESDDSYLLNTDY